MSSINSQFKVLLNKLVKLTLFLGLGFSLFCSEKDINKSDDKDEGKVLFWLTSPVENIYFTEQASIESSEIDNDYDSIVVNSDITFQEIDGFGFALTGGSAYHIHNMSASERSNLLTELFDYKGNNIGASYLRVSIGASDLDFEPFSYDDLEPGETDVNMEHFSLDKDLRS